MKTVPVQEAFTKSKALAFLGGVYLLLTVSFGFIPGTMVNYGYDYWQFLHPLWVFVPIIGCLVLWKVSERILAASSNWVTLSFADRKSVV